jgi:steroid 5-alpha reductase family enzyme
MTAADLLPSLAGLVVLSLVMGAAWARQRRTGNAGLVDVIWSASIGALAALHLATADGWLPRRLLVCGIAIGWSVRLTAYLARRVASEPEDGRYRELRDELGASFDRWILWFFQAQALLAVLLSLAMLVPASAPGPEAWRLQDVLGLALFVVSLVGESVADRQLHAWRREPANRGRTCRAGLWRYSRHPNYFFEWLHWLVYPLIGIGLPLGWTLWLAPLVMYAFVVRVTGIPPTERQSLRSRGDDYRAYQRTTNAFFPGPPRTDPAS